MKHCSLFCYSCMKLCAHYTCEHCGSDDVEPYNTDGGMVEDAGQEAEQRNDALASARYSD